MSERGSRIAVLKNLAVYASLHVSGIDSAIAWQRYGQPARRLNIKLSITNEGSGVRIWRLS